MIDWLNDNSAAVQAVAVVALVLVTAVYAWRTHDISKAAREQASASVEMAREMREQRMSASQPLVMPDIKGVNPIPGQVNVGLHLTNVGNGPALEVIRTVRHPSVSPPEGRHSQRWPAVYCGSCQNAGFVLTGSAGSHANSGELELSWRDIHGRTFGWRFPMDVQTGRHATGVELLEGEFLYPGREDP